MAGLRGTITPSSLLKMKSMRSLLRPAQPNLLRYLHQRSQLLNHNRVFFSLCFWFGFPKLNMFLTCLKKQVGTTLLWNLTVLGWEVNYKEEFVPDDEGSYTLIVQKGRKMGWQEGSILNSFTNREPGKVVLTIDNGSFKKKRVLYRFKTRTSSASSAVLVAA